MTSNKNILFLIFLIFLFSCSENVEEIVANQSGNIEYAGTSSTLDIVTWNIEWFPKHSDTNQYLYNIISLLNVDIFALQEIQKYDDFNVLQTMLGSHWVAFRSAGDSQWGRLAYLINSNAIDLTNTPYTILNDEDEEIFAHKFPYVLEFNYKEQEFILINVHYKAYGDGILNLNNENDEEYKRLQASQLIHNYIVTNFDNKNVIILGDFNDLIIEESNSNNVFTPFVANQYIFSDYSIATGDVSNYSYPSRSSHIDHIILSNELFNNYSYITNTINVETYFLYGLADYYKYISDHRPIAINLNIP